MAQRGKFIAALMVNAGGQQLQHLIWSNSASNNFTSRRFMDAAHPRMASDKCVYAFFS